MARSTESNDSGEPTGPDKRGWRHFGDGFAGRLVAARLQAYNPTTLAYQDVTVDNASGGLVTSGGGGGGGAATIADGADVAQGTTTDLSSANTVIGLLKAIKAFLAGTLTVSGSLGRSWTLSSGTDSVATTDGGGSLTVDAPVGTPLWVRLSDGAAAFVGQKAMAASIPVVIASDQSSLPTTEARLPTALGANGGLKIEGVASGTVVPVSLGTNTPDVTDRAARLLGVVSGAANVFHVDDNAGSLTVDAPVGTPAFVRLSDGAAAITTLPVSMATNTPDVTDRAARLLGIVDKGKVWDGTNIAAVKAASAVAAATDPAFVVQHAPQRADAANLCVTNTAATGVACTLTIPAAGAGLFHYISLIEIQLYATAARTGGAAPVLVTTTNLPGSPVWDFDTAQAIGVTIRQTTQPATPIKSSVANTATTIVAPIATTGIWRITAYYYAAP